MTAAEPAGGGSSTPSRPTAGAVPGVDAGGRYLRDLLDVPFTDAQLDIVTAPLAPQLVIAGAGSGKTTVMAARVVHGVAFHGVPASGVLGLTFTNKAAGELAERVRRALARLAGMAGSAGVTTLIPAEVLDDQPTVLTYHAYAAALIRDHALRIGREPDARLLTEAGRWQLALRVVRAGEGPYEHLDWATPTVAQYLLDLDGELSEHLVGPAAVRSFDTQVQAAVAASPSATRSTADVVSASHARDQLLDLVDAYRGRKRALDLVDFGDQVALAAEIARRCPEVGAGERARFPVVFLDEYQDTGVAQRLLLAELYAGGHPVTAVGDPCQSIYGWRGASIGNLLRFPAHFPRVDGSTCSPQYLLTSFRSSRAVLDVANNVSEELRRYDGTRRRPHVEVPPLTAGRDVPGRVRVAMHRTVEDEAGWLADEIAAEISGGTPAGEVAVLCRRRADFAVLHESLTTRDVPVEVVGLGGLLSMPEVGDVVAVLEVLADPTANPALVRILTGPRYRVGPRDLAVLGRRATRLATLEGTPRGLADPADDPDGARALTAATASVDPCDVVALTDAIERPGDPAAYSPEGFARLRALAAELEALRPLVAQPIVEAVSGVVAAIGLDVEIEASPSASAAARAANLAAFLDHAARFEGIEGESDLAAFLAYLAAAQDKENGFDVGGVSTADTVKLLTVHKAKGLEWRVVAVPCLVQGTFPPGKGRSRWPTNARVLPYPLRGDRDDLPADPAWTNAGLTAFRTDCTRDDLEEERRLAYVAVTRAKDVLLASGHCWNRTRSTPCAPSPFLIEVRAACESRGLDVVASWCTDPGADNPLRVAGKGDVTWPAPYDAEALARRRSGAVLVEAALLDAAGANDAVTELSARDAVDVASWEREVGQLLDELAAGRTLVRDVPLPRSLSASQVVALATDPEELARSLARPMPRRPSAVARRGTAFHAWVERLSDARPLFEDDEIPGAADENLPGSPDDDELAELQAAFARTPYADLKPYAVEEPFELLIGGRLLRGRIDAVYRTGDGYDVVDYKTGQRPGAPAAAALQLAIYRLAWAGIAGVPVGAVGAAFLYVRTGDLVRPELPDAARLAAILAGEAPVGDATAGEVVRPDPGSGCIDATPNPAGEAAGPTNEAADPTSEAAGPAGPATVPENAVTALRRSPDRPPRRPSDGQRALPDDRRAVPGGEEEQLALDW